ncbi:MAG: hypothetical protein U5Q44_12180 [Dehalococcoidia bacterium]|nr:hypothetical protein [Dehalococcoidia bacterium]
MSMRTLSAAIVAVQVGGFVLLATLPETRWALYGGSIAVGQGVGNLITLPALIAQAEFGLASFGKLYGMVAAANQLGIGVAAFGVAALRDVLGGYEAAWIALALLEVVAMAIMWPAWLRLLRMPMLRK